MLDRDPTATSTLIRTKSDKLDAIFLSLMVKSSSTPNVGSNMGGVKNRPGEGAHKGGVQLWALGQFRGPGKVWKWPGKMGQADI